MYNFLEKLSGSRLSQCVLSATGKHSVDMFDYRQSCGARLSLTTADRSQVPVFQVKVKETLPVVFLTNLG